MFIKIKNRLQILESYLWGVHLKNYYSSMNGKLELTLINNKKVLNSKNANQSFDSLHRIFQKIFSKIDIGNMNHENILLLGLGCGSVPAILFDEMKLNCRITAVEHDPLMIEIGKENFNLNRFSKMKIVIDDAENFVSSCHHKFDIIIIDLFNDNHVPDKFYSKNFNSDVCDLLNENGILIFNTMTQTLPQQEKFSQLIKYYPDAEAVKLNGTNKVIIHQKIIASLPSKES